MIGRTTHVHVWHLEVDTPRRPETANPGEPVVACVGTWPIEPGQTVWASFVVRCPSGRCWQDTRKGVWLRNEGPNSYWEIDLGRFEAGDQVVYKVLGEDRAGVVVATREFTLRVTGAAAAACKPGLDPASPAAARA